MCNILIEFTKNNPLRMLAWIGIFYSLAGLMQQKLYSTGLLRIIFLAIWQFFLLFSAFYINFTIDLDNTIQSISTLGSIK